MKLKKKQELCVTAIYLQTENRQGHPDYFTEAYDVILRSFCSVQGDLKRTKAQCTIVYEEAC